MDHVVSTKIKGNQLNVFHENEFKFDSNPNISKSYWLYYYSFIQILILLCLRLTGSLYQTDANCILKVKP